MVYGKQPERWRGQNDISLQPTNARLPSPGQLELGCSQITSTSRGGCSCTEGGLANYQSAGPLPLTLPPLQQKRKPPTPAHETHLRDRGCRHILTYVGIVESTRNQAFFGPEVPCSRGIAAITAGKEHLSMLSYFQLFPHITVNIKVVPGNTRSSRDSSHRSEISQFILSPLSFHQGLDSAPSLCSPG